MRFSPISFFYLFWIIALSSWSFAALDISIDTPATNGSYFTTSIPVVNVTTSLYAVCSYSINGSSPTNFTPVNATVHNISSLNISSFGDATLLLNVSCYETTDSGNSNNTLRSFIKDTIAPTTSDDTPSGWQGSDFNITLTPNDSGSVDYTSYRIDGGSWFNGTTVSINTTGNHSVDYYSVDSAGNIESTNQVYAALDKESPEINFTVISNSSVISSFSATINVSITDSHIGTFDSCLYSLNDQSNVSFNCSASSFDVSSLTEGYDSVEVFVNDSVGNSAIEILNFSVAVNPVYSDMHVITPAKYVLNKRYDFNITWNDNSSLDKVLLNINGSNYTMSNYSATGYNVSVMNLTPGNHSYYFFANDTHSNSNSTANFTLEILNLSSSSTIAENSSETLSGNVTEIIIPANSTTSQVVISSNISSSQQVSINFSNLVSSGNVSVGSNISFIREVSSVNHSVLLEEGTVISGSADWDGILSAPIVNSSTFSVSGGTVGAAITIGTNQSLNLSSPAKIVIGGKAGTKAGWSSSGSTTLTPITTVCNDVSNPSNINSSVRECYGDSGSDLVIWTYHFTTFGSYTENSQDSGSSGGGSSSSSRPQKIYTMGDLKYISIEKSLKRDEGIDFRVDGEEHRVTVKRIRGGDVTLIVESTPKEYTLEENESRVIEIEDEKFIEINFTFVSSSEIRVFLNMLSEETETPTANTFEEDSGDEGFTEDPSPSDNGSFDESSEEGLGVQDIVEDDQAEEVTEETDAEGFPWLPLGMIVLIIVILGGFYLYRNVR